MKQAHYATVSEAVELLRNQGFTTDFKVEVNLLTCPAASFTADEFDIVDVYRYEGDSDPADEAIVYGIQARSGLKGILIMGYGAADDPISDQILVKLRRN